MRHGVILAICVVVAASRLPFLMPGYGTDPDAWALAAAGRLMAEGDGYVLSRMPGYPIPEAFAAIVWRLTSSWEQAAAVLGGLTALAGVACTFFFNRICTQARIAGAAWAALAFAFTPVVYLNSVAFMDYLWALAAMLAALDAGLRGRAIPAGILLAWASGCRLTSIALLPAVRAALKASNIEFAATRGLKAADPAFRRTAYKGLACFLGAALFLTLWTYTSVHITVGSDPRHISRPPEGVPLSRMISLATLHVWGFAGLMGLATAGLWEMTLRLRRRSSSPGSALSAAVASPLKRAVRIAGWMAFAIYLVLFLFHPLEAGYLIPIVPFVLLLLADGLQRGPFRLACVAICLSPFAPHLGRVDAAIDRPDAAGSFRWSVGGKQVQLSLFDGVVWRDHRRRAAELDELFRLVERIKELSRGTVVVVGYYLPHLEVLAAPGANIEHYRQVEIAGRRLVYSLNEAQWQSCTAEHREVFFLPAMAELNLEATGFDLRRTDARALD